MAKLKLCITLLLTIIQAGKSNNNNIYQCYEGSITCSAEFKFAHPTSLEDIRELVLDSLKKNVKLKAVGSLHSISDSICTKGKPVSLINIQHFIFNPNNKTAMVGTGMELMDFLNKLNEYNRTILSPPMYGGITIGGAVANGAHGTGFLNPTLSESIVSIIIVDGMGNIRTVKKGDQDFTAVIVNLGLLGILYQVEFATVEQYKLSIKHYPANETILWNTMEIIDRAKQYDHFQFWWFPTSKTAVVSEGTRVSLETPGNCQTTMVQNMTQKVSLAYSLAFENFQSSRNYLAMFQMQVYAMFSLYLDVKAIKPFFVKEDGTTSCLDDPIGLSHKMKVNSCNSCYLEGNANVLKTMDSEVMIPIEKLPDALKALHKIFHVRLTNLPMVGIWVRFVSSGSSLMGINKGGNGWAAIEWITPIRWDLTEPRLGMAAFQAMGKNLTKTFKGRPHWGKNGLLYSNPNLIREVHGAENVEIFLKIRKDFDPQDIFMNSFGERLNGSENGLKVEPKLSKKCALNEVCECKTNGDCGNGRQPVFWDYECKEFSKSNKNPVCAPTSTVELVMEALTREIIDELGYNETTIVEALLKYSELKDVFA